MGKREKKLPARKVLVDQVQKAMSEHLIERDEQVEGFLCALLAREHMLLVGPPGTAKSMLCEMGCNVIDGMQFFSWLMTKFSTPEELFGPVSVSKLEKDVYERLTSGKLPEASIAFLDEIFKANSAILNCLLKVVNERKFHNGGVEVDVPLETMVAASNEFPDGVELAALYDRFALKYIVNYVGDDNFIRLLDLMDNPNPQQPVLIQRDILVKARKEAAALIVSQSIKEKLYEIRRKLRSEKNIVPSDRKWGQIMKMIRAKAYLAGHDKVELSDLSIMKDIVWFEEKQIQPAREIILNICNPAAKFALDISNQIQSVVAPLDLENKSGKIRGDQYEAELLEAKNKLNKINRNLVSLVEQYGEESFVGLSELISSTLSEIARVLFEG